MSDADTRSAPAPAVSAVRTPTFLPPLERPKGDRHLGGYELVATLGEGGMGSVCIARRAGPGGFRRRVALKRIHPHLASDGAVAMFLDEARLAATITHRNVAQTYDLGTIDGTYYLVLELIEGAHAGVLSKACGQKMPLGVALFIASEAARGLHAAHEARDPAGAALHLVHRDVSPSNILVGYDGSVKITDFGVAKARNRLAHTDTGLVRGKAAYMSPEQALGEDVDRRSDVFSLGVILYEWCLGRPAFGEGPGANVVLRVVRNDRPSVWEVAPDFPKQLGTLIEGCLAPNRAARPPTARALADALDAWRTEHAPADAADLARLMEARLGLDRQVREAQLAALEAEPPPASTPPSQPIEAATPAATVVSVDGGRIPPARSRRWMAMLAAGGAIVAASALAFAQIAREGDIDERVSSSEPAIAAVAEVPHPIESPSPAPATEPDRGSAMAADEPQSVDRDAGEPARRRRAAEPGTGFLNITARPAADVLVDGRSVGETPIVLLPLTAGRHRLELRREGAPTHRASIGIQAGETTALRHDFPAAP